MKPQIVGDSSKLTPGHIAEAERLMEMVGELPKGTAGKGD